MCHQEMESLRSQLDRCQLVCRIHSCWADRLQQLQNFPASILRLSLPLHYMSFGTSLAIQLMGQQRIQTKSSETKSKAREAGVLHLPPFPWKMTVLTLNLLLACLSPDIFCFFSNKKSLFWWLLAKPAERNKETNRSKQQLRFLHIIWIVCDVAEIKNI